MLTVVKAARLAARLLAPVKLFLCGDVMTGRGIDQVMAAPCDPSIHEPFARSALDYVRLAEEANGPVPRGVAPAYVWGEALEELERAAPHARIVNLETAVTTSADRQPKGINYRMSPANAACLAAARIDCCALANNHVLDWGEAGLAQTLSTLQGIGIRCAGAGLGEEAAWAPARIASGDGRLLFFSCAAASSGVPRAWRARAGRAGVALLPDLSARTLGAIGERIAAERRAGDLVVVSVHWGSNWDYAVTEEEQRFARGLLLAGAHVVHGHSSHHAKGIEVFDGKLILYGCGDLVNDYEGIGGHEAFRGELGVLYFATLDRGAGRLLRLEMSVMRMRRLRLERAGPADVSWLGERLAREGRRFGTRVEAAAGGLALAL